jgi:hypothetical protein
VPRLRSSVRIWIRLVLASAPWALLRCAAGSVLGGMARKYHGYGNN